MTSYSLYHKSIRMRSMPFMALSHNHLIDNLTRSEFIVGITRPMALLYKTLHIYSVVPSSDKQRSLYKQV